MPRPAERRSVPRNDISSILAEGIRYERSGVTERAIACFEQVTTRADENPAVAAEAWWRLANQERLQSRWSQALEAARRGAALAREHGLVTQEADALNIEGGVWMNRADYASARPLFEQVLALVSSGSTRAKALQNLGGIAGEERAFEEAERLFLASRAEYAAVGDARGEAISLLNLGRLQMERGDPELARATLEDAVTDARRAGDLEMHAAALLNLGIALSELRCASEAEERITTAYGQFTIADIPMQRVRCLMQLSRVALLREDASTARVCLMHARDVATLAQLPRELRLIVDQLQRLGDPG
jgi:tetratricopeptide (TPR) repeat protein